jgi:DNA-binding XRE family transcriptional regulator
MGSQILRPTKTKGQLGDWVIQGPWGSRTYPKSSKVDFYETLHRELIQSGLLQEDYAIPSRRHHSDVTMLVMQCSWIKDRWMRDEAFSSRLKHLREKAGLTQEELASKSGLDVGTIRQLEQATRTKPLWQSVCALSRGLGMEVSVFLGTDGWQPPESAPK